MRDRELSHLFQHQLAVQYNIGDIHIDIDIDRLYQLLKNTLKVFYVAITSVQKLLQQTCIMMNA